MDKLVAFLILEKKLFIFCFKGGAQQNFFIKDLLPWGCGNS